jgi:hypothetical protein
MKQYVPETSQATEPVKKKKKKKKNDSSSSSVTKRDYGLTENAKVIME